MNTIDDLQVALIDYEMGNLFSVKRACEYVGLKPIITSDKSVIMNSDAAILPGVGAFGDAINNLKKLDLISPIKEFIAMGKPFMGICLGMQLLLSESEEFGNHKGLNIVEGSVVKFPTKNKEDQKFKVPQVGWNRIFQLSANGEDWNKSPLKNIKNGEFMYFIHSYYAKPILNENILTITNYANVDYASSIVKENLYAFQFHPEMSSKKGIDIYRNLKFIIENGDTL